MAAVVFAVLLLAPAKDDCGIDGNTDRFYGVTFSALWLVNLI